MMDGQNFNERKYQTNRQFLSMSCESKANIKIRNERYSTVKPNQKCPCLEMCITEKTWGIGKATVPPAGCFYTARSTQLQTCGIFFMLKIVGKVCGFFNLFFIFSSKLSQKLAHLFIRSSIYQQQPIFLHITLSISSGMKMSECLNLSSGSTEILYSLTFRKRKINSSITPACSV